MNKNSENFKNLLTGLKCNFRFTCFSETRLNDFNYCDQDHKLPNYKSIGNQSRRVESQYTSIKMLDLKSDMS